MPWAIVHPSSCSRIAYSRSTAAAPENSATARKARLTVVVTMDGLYAGVALAYPRNASTGCNRDAVTDGYSPALHGPTVDSLKATKCLLRLFTYPRLVTSELSLYERTQLPCAENTGCQDNVPR
jgi:hypothetical protein